VSSESSEDASVRRGNEMAEAELKRKMTYALFCFALVIVAIVFGGCLYTFALGTVDDKKWASGINSAIVSGLVGFLVGQGKNNSTVGIDRIHAPDSLSSELRRIL
jgi:hypothetical protein